MESSAKRKLATRLFSPIGSFLPVGRDTGRDQHWFGIEQPVHEVDEVAGLAENGAADAGIGHPVVAGNAGRVDAQVENSGPVAPHQLLFQLRDK